MSQSVSKCLTMGQQVPKGVICLHIQVRELSLLGIAVAGVYCCMGLTQCQLSRCHACCYVQNPQSSVSIDRDHLSLDWLSLFQSTAYPEKIALL